MRTRPDEAAVGAPRRLSHGDTTTAMATTDRHRRHDDRHTSADCDTASRSGGHCSPQARRSRFGRAGRVADGDADGVGAGLRRRAAQHPGGGVDGDTRRQAWSPTRYRELCLRSPSRSPSRAGSTRARRQRRSGDLQLGRLDGEREGLAHGGRVRRRRVARGHRHRAAGGGRRRARDGARCSG